MSKERFKNISEKIKNGLKGKEKELQVPGFIYTKDTYKVDPRYIDAGRKPYEMPVKPDYGIMKGILLGAPQVVIHEVVAASPRNPKPPTVTQLEDINYYKKNLMIEQLPSPPPLEKGCITSPIEIRPFATRNAFIFPAIEVQYAYSVQALGEESKKLEVFQTTPRSVDKGKIDIYNSPERELEGLAYVAHVREPVDLSKYFSPTEFDLIENFSGKIPLSVKEAENTKKAQKAQNIFEKLFQPKLERIGEQVETLRKNPIKGILLSPIVPHYRQYDVSRSLISYDPKGEFVIAATYLV